MDYYNKKLESLENEFNATMNHAVKVVEEYVATYVEKEVVEAQALEAIEHFIDGLSKPKPTLQPNPEGIILEESVKFLNDAEKEELWREFSERFLEELETLKRNYLYL